MTTDESKQPPIKGQAGGKAVYDKYGKDYMRKMGKAGAKTTWKKYRLTAVGTSGYSMVDRESDKIIAIW